MRSHYRILVIAPTGFFADYGCHVRIRGHAATLQARGHQVLIVTYPGGRDVDALRTVRPPSWRRGHDMPVGSSPRKFLLDTLLVPVLWMAARRFRPHIVHAYLHEGALLGAVLPPLRKVPLVFDFQGSLVGEMIDHRFLSSRSHLVPAWQRLERWIDRQPAAILASSVTAAGLLCSDVGIPLAQVQPLPDSVDAAQFRPADAFAPAELARLRVALNLPAGRPLVVYLGLLAAYQGIDLLLQAARRVVDTTSPAPYFLIMGFPHVAHYRARAAALGLQQDVLFTGKIAYEDAPRYLALGQVAVAPKVSASEGSGKLLTYMAAALPVVAFDTPVQREVLGESGIYAAAGDVAGLALALRSALSDPDAGRGLGAALRQRALTSFTWDQAAQTIETTYARVLG